MYTVFATALLVIAACSDKTQSLSATATIISGDRLRIGTSHDVIEVQGVLLSAAQVALPSAPIPEDKKLGLQGPPPTLRTPERPKQALPRVSEHPIPER